MCQYFRIVWNNGLAPTRRHAVGLFEPVSYINDAHMPIPSHISKLCGAYWHDAKKYTNYHIADAAMCNEKHRDFCYIFHTYTHNKSRTLPVRTHPGLFRGIYGYLHPYRLDAKLIITHCNLGGLMSNRTFTMSWYLHGCLTRYVFR